MNEEVKKIYDYCVTNERTHTAVADSLGNKELKALYEQSATAFWNVKSFIEVNFMEK